MLRLGDQEVNDNPEFHKDPGGVGAGAVVRRASEGWCGVWRRSVWPACVARSCLGWFLRELTEPLDLAGVLEL